MRAITLESLEIQMALYEVASSRPASVCPLRLLRRRLRLLTGGPTMADIMGSSSGKIRATVLPSVVIGVGSTVLNAATLY